MKRSIEIIGLPVMSINEGNEIGRINKLVIDAEKGCIEGLVLSTKKCYEVAKVLPFSSIIGIGNKAIIIENENAIYPIISDKKIIKLIDDDIQIIGTQVFTRKGATLGNITEIFIDSSTGSITSLELNEEDGTVTSIAAKNIITYGPKITFINDVNNEDETSQVAATIDSSIKKTIVGPNVGEIKLDSSLPDGNKDFNEINNKYLVGKKCSIRITANDGAIVIEKGEVITEETIEKAKLAGKLIELSMNAQ